MKNYILLLFLSFVFLSCSKQDKELEYLQHEQNKGLADFYSQHFFMEYVKAGEFLKREDSLDFQQMKEIATKMLTFDADLNKLSKKQKLDYIVAERKKLKKLNPNLKFIDLQMIENFNDSLFNSTVKEDFMRSNYHIILDFNKKHRYGDLNINSAEKGI